MNINLKNISIFSMLRDIVYNAWVLVLTAIIAYIGSYVYVNSFHKDAFTATMTVAVNQKNTVSYSATTLTKTNETATVFQTLFQSDIMREKVRQLTGKQMEGTVSATVIESTNLMTLKSTASTPVGAFETLELIYKNYKALTDYSFDQVVMYVLSYPVVPSAPSNPISVISVAKKAVIAAVAFVTVIILALSFLRDTVKTDAGVKSILLLDVYASVSHERKNKTLKAFFEKKNKRLMLTDPLVDQTYIKAFSKIAMKLDYLHNSKNKQVIMISSTNENEGKTTVAVNTALSLVTKGNRVLLLDLDLRKPSVWRFFSDLSLSDAHRQIAEVIKNRKLNSVEAVRDPVSGVYVLGGKKSVTHSSEYISGSRFALIMQKLREQFDYIIIDTPPYALISDAEIIASYSDAMLLVVRQDSTAVDAINSTISALGKKTSIVGCVFNDVKTVTGMLPGNLRKFLPSNSAKYY